VESPEETPAAARRITVEVNYPACQSHGRCVAAAPEVFRMGSGYGSAYPEVLLRHPPPELEEKVRRASRVCPTKAILLNEY
jgi:ferredoxin